MKIENTKAQMRKGVLEYCILSILQHGDAYTSEIISTLKSAEMIVVEGTIYPLLTRLKNSGLLNHSGINFCSMSSLIPSRIRSVINNV